MGFTNTYKLWNSIILSGKAALSQSDYSHRIYLTKFTDGNGYYMSLCGNGDPAYSAFVMGDIGNSCQINDAHAGYVHIGDDDTPFDPDDYCLGNEIASGKITYASNSSLGTNLCLGYNVFTSIDPHNAYTEIVITGKNTTENTITIREIGLSKGMSCRDSPNSSTLTMRRILLIREVLENPVEVTPGSQYILKLKIKFS